MYQVGVGVGMGMGVGVGAGVGMSMGVGVGVAGGDLIPGCASRRRPGSEGRKEGIT